MKKFLLGIAVMLAVFALLIVYEVIDVSGIVNSESGIPGIKIESKELQASDVSITYGSQGLTSVSLNVLAHRDIEYIVIRVNFIDKDGHVVKVQEQKFHSLTSGVSYKYEYKLGILDSFKFSKYSYEILEGKRK